MPISSEADTLPLAAADDRGDAAVAATYGRFVARRLIGRGGMGVVLRAWDPELDRDVAIKLVAPAMWRADPDGAERLHREAQAMAKLSHPNVVSIYEVGRLGDDRFIAMELVEGPTLRRWMAEHDGDTAAVLAMFLQCGHGLAAAHAAGLVHRDFKPENVLIGGDGRPRVSDFGLVASGVAVTEEDVRDGRADHAVTASFSVHGVVVGTPAYMAPEQWRGEATDARTDQFAFCLALWEALYGQRAFDGDGPLRDRVLTGELTPPPSTRRVSSRIGEALRRGLARSPAARWPTMEVLLAELGRRRRRLWPWLAGGVAASAIAAVAVALTVGATTEEECPDPATGLAGVWDGATRAKITARFEAVSPVLAGETLGRIVPELDGYASRWRAGVVAACRATRVDGTQSAAALDGRIRCLDDLRAELRGVTAAFAVADASRVGDAIDDVHRLRAIEHCAEPAAVAASAPPADPALRASLAALDGQIAMTRAARATAPVATRRALADAGVEWARALGYAPAVSRALVETYVVAQLHGDHAAVEAILREQAQLAAVGKDDVRIADAWSRLLQFYAHRRKLTEAGALRPVAEAAVIRAGSTPALRYALAAGVGTHQIYAGEPADGIATLRGMIDLATNVTQRVEALRILAQAQAMLGALPEASETIARCLAEAETVYGPRHTDTADILHASAQIDHFRGQLDSAITAERRALAIREAALGPDHDQVAASVHTLGNIAIKRGDLATGRAELQRAIAIYDRRGDLENASISRSQLAQALDPDDRDAIGGMYRAALDGLERSGGKDRLIYAQVEANYAGWLVPDDCAAARPLIAHGRAVMTPANPAFDAMFLDLEAQCADTAGDVASAIAKLTEARALCRRIECEVPFLETITYRLATALNAARREPQQVRALLAEAEALATEHQAAALLAEIASWRAAHPAIR
jgi:eukaryotic-like serine/threonine-protein kinase